MKKQKKTEKKRPTMLCSVRMPETLRDDLRRIAEAESRTLSQQIIYILKRGVATVEGKDA